MRDSPAVPFSPFVLSLRGAAAGPLEGCTQPQLNMAPKKLTGPHDRKNEGLEGIKYSLPEQATGRDETLCLLDAAASTADGLQEAEVESSTLRALRSAGYAAEPSARCHPPKHTRFWSVRRERRFGRVREKQTGPPSQRISGLRPCRLPWCVLGWCFGVGRGFIGTFCVVVHRLVGPSDAKRSEAAGLSEAKRSDAADIV